MNNMAPIMRWVCWIKGHDYPRRPFKRGEYKVCWRCAKVVLVQLGNEDVRGDG